MQEKKNARLAEERAEEAKERGAEASSHSGESLKKKVQHAAHVAQEKATEATNTVKEKATEAAHTAQETAQKAKHRVQEMMDYQQNEPSRQLSSMAGRLITLTLKHITQSKRIVSGEIFQFFFQPFTDEEQTAFHRPHRQS